LLEVFKSQKTNEKPVVHVAYDYKSTFLKHLASKTEQMEKKEILLHKFSKPDFGSATVIIHWRMSTFSLLPTK
jgi:hypothetical protein